MRIDPTWRHSRYGEACDEHAPQRDSVFADGGKFVRRLDVVVTAESFDLPDDLDEIIALLPPGTYTRQRLCDQLNSAIGGHAWGQVYGTVE